MTQTYLEGVYMTAEEFAEATGISVATVKRRCVMWGLSSGPFACLKVGRQWLIRIGTDFVQAQKALDDFIQRVGAAHG